MIPPRPLPDKALALSELSLGCAQLGNMYREVPDADAVPRIPVGLVLERRLPLRRGSVALGLVEQLQPVPVRITSP